MKILVPVDGSACALRAVEQLIAHGDWFRETPEIHLLNVHAPIPLGRVQAHIGKETLHEYYLEESRAQLVDAEKKLDAAGFVYNKHVHVGQAAELIAKMASELACDLVIMGTHGRSAVAGLVMGSVASRAVHLLTCPVMLVK